ncbi:MAG: DUF4837 family protein [bacterium]
MKSINGYYAALVAATVFLLMTLISCGTKQSAGGEEDEIYVVADSIEYSRLQASLLQVFSKIILTPQPEKLFKLKRKNFSELEDVKSKKNVIVVAPINSGSEVSEFITTILDSADLAKVKTGNKFYFTKYDLWVREQLVMVLSATSLEMLNEKLLGKHEDLPYYFQNISNKRLSQSLYEPEYEKIDIQAELLDRYGWIIYVQKDFILDEEQPADNFVLLRKSTGDDMESRIFVHWIDNCTPDYLNKDSVWNERNRITNKYFRNSTGSAFAEIADDYKTASEVNFNGRYAIMMQGLWRMSDKSMGGPFVNYTFFDEITHRVYMIDGSVYAPKYFKKKLIQQLDVLLQSFMTKEELSKERREELMDELK